MTASSATQTKWLAMGLGVVIATLAIGCSTPGIAPTPTPASDAVKLEEFGLQLFWDRPLPLRACEQVYNLYSLDENVYAYTTGGRVICIDARSGLHKWTCAVAASGGEMFDPTHVGGVMLPKKLGDVESILHPSSVRDEKTFDAVFITTPRRLMVLDRKTGEIYRDVEFDTFTAAGRGVSDGRMFYVCGSDRLVHGIRLLQGVTVWTAEMESRKVLQAPLSISPPWLYIPSLSGDLQVEMVGDYHRRQWSLEIGSSLQWGVYVDDRGLFFGAGDDCVYGYDAEVGRRLWQPVPVRGQINTPAQVGDRSIFQAAIGAGMHAVDLTKGTLRWTVPGGTQVVGIIEGNAYIADRTGRIQVVNEITGEAQFTVRLPGLSRFATNVSRPSVFAARPSGQLYCIRPTSAGHLTPAMVPNP